MRPFSTLFFGVTATLLFSIEAMFAEAVSAPKVPLTQQTLEADSIPIYQEQIYRYTDSYNHKRKAGNSLLAAGAGIIATSAYPFYEAYSCEKEDDCMSNAAACVIGDCLMGTSKNSFSMKSTVVLRHSSSFKVANTTSIHHFSFLL